MGVPGVGHWVTIVTLRAISLAVKAELCFMLRTVRGKGRCQSRGTFDVQCLLGHIKPRAPCVLVRKQTRLVKLATPTMTVNDFSDGTTLTQQQCQEAYR